MRFWLAQIMVFAAALCLCACGQKNYLNENDALRAKVLQQQTEIDDLKRRTEEMRIALENATTAPSDISREVRLATPHPVEISISSLSHVRREDGQSSKLLIYVSPVDGRSRFTQLVGTIQISAFLLPMSAEPSAIGQLTATPTQVREAYRHTLMSTHYSFEMPLDLPPPAEGSASNDAIFVRVLFTDGYTGQTLIAEKAVSVK